MNRYLYPVVLLFLFLLPVIPKAHSSEPQVPHFLNFQSVLFDDNGGLIKDQFIDLEFYVTDPEGNVLYSEKQEKVQVIKGAVNVLVGEGTIINSNPLQATGGMVPEVFDPATGSKTPSMLPRA